MGRLRTSSCQNLGGKLLAPAATQTWLSEPATEQSGALLLSLPVVCC